MNSKDIKKSIKNRYGQIAKEKNNCCNTCNLSPIEQAKIVGYSEKELNYIPDSAVMGLGCGNPVASAYLKKGETVLESGAGTGIDVFLSANKVGPCGHVIGIDMTKEMISRSNRIAERYGYKNVEFRLGEIENLPVEDNSIDVIISNCVINLSPNKAKAFKEAHRVLKHGGRIIVSDIVTEDKLPDNIKIKNNLDAWVRCIAGALEKNEYLNMIRKAGFENVKIVSENSFGIGKYDEKLKIKGIKVMAVKK